MAVRIALGATRRQLIRQMLVESVTLASSGAALGLALALGATHLVSRLPHTTIPLLPEVRVDARVLAFTILVAVLSGLAFGLWPALHGSGVSPQQAMQDSSRGSSAGRDSWVRRAMVVSEIALVCVLLTGTGLLLRSFVRILAVHPGFESAHAIAVRVDPSRAAATAAEINAHFDAVVREVGAVSGVEAVGLTDALPLGDNFGWRTWDASPGGPPIAGGPHPGALVRIIDAGYFAAMRIPLRAGRAFAASDTASGEPVIIINDTLARAFWPNDDPIGRMVYTSGVNRRVVGVVGEVSYFGLDRHSGPEMYMPLQSGDYQRVDLVVRSARPAAQLMPDIRAALRRVDPQLPVADFRTMESLVDRSVFVRRAVVVVIGAFAGFGLILASLGLYAVIAYWVSQRTVEIGIRLALGASPRELQQRIVTQTLTLAVVGLAIGMPASWLAARAIQGLLFGILPSDAFTFVSVFALLTSVAVLASYVPARRASRIDPMAALRAN
jgi:predicted permease